MSTRNPKAVILMGSKADLDFCKQIAEKLKLFSIESDLRIASAHKTPEHVLNILKSYEERILASRLCFLASSVILEG